MQDIQVMTANTAYGLQIALSGQQREGYRLYGSIAVNPQSDIHRYVQVMVRGTAGKSECDPVKSENTEPCLLPPKHHPDLKPNLSCDGCLFVPPSLKTFTCVTCTRLPRRTDNYQDALSF